MRINKCIRDNSRYMFLKRIVISSSLQRASILVVSIIADCESQIMLVDSSRSRGNKSIRGSKSSRQTKKAVSAHNVSELLVVKALLFGTRVAHSEIFTDHTYESSRPSSEQNRFLFVKIPNSGIRCDVVVLWKKEHHESINQSHQFIDKNIPNRKILSVVPIPKRTQRLTPNEVFVSRFAHPGLYSNKSFFGRESCGVSGGIRWNPTCDSLQETQREKRGKKRGHPFFSILQRDCAEFFIPRKHRERNTGCELREY